MHTTTIELAGRTCVLIDAADVVVRDVGAGRDLAEAALNSGASVVAVPVAAFDPAFFDLRSGIAGEVMQKVLQYRCVFAIVGDVSEYAAASNALRDFIVECDRGRDILFVPDLEALADRLVAINAGSRPG